MRIAKCDKCGAETNMLVGQEPGYYYPADPFETVLVECDEWIACGRCNNELEQHIHRSKDKATRDFFKEGIK